MWGHVKYEIYDFASGNSESKKKKKKRSRCHGNRGLINKSFGMLKLKEK